MRKISKKKKMTYFFTTSINKEGKWYVANCVELGVVSQGKTIEEAQKNLKEAVKLYIEDNSEINLPSKAPLIGTLEVRHA